MNAGTPIFLCAHTDTVPPETRIDPVVGEDGVVRNAAGTILGSDNKAAVVVMLEAVRRVLEEERGHAGIELLFTPQEEVSLRGADAFDHTRLVARTGFVYDQGEPIGEIVLGSPHARLLDFRFHGAAAHAGMHPEDGRSAIAAASRAIADFRLGRIDGGLCGTWQVVGADRRHGDPDRIRNAGGAVVADRPIFEMLLVGREGRHDRCHQPLKDTPEKERSSKQAGQHGNPPRTSSAPARLHLPPTEIKNSGLRRAEDKVEQRERNVATAHHGEEGRAGKPAHHSEDRRERMGTGIEGRGNIDMETSASSITARRGQISGVAGSTPTNASTSAG